MEASSTWGSKVTPVTKFNASVYTASKLCKFFKPWATHTNHLHEYATKRLELAVVVVMWKGVEKK